MGKYSIDKERFKMVRPGRYWDRVAGEEVSRARAIKITQGRTHHAIAREQQALRIAELGHHGEAARKALKQEFGTASPLYRDAMQELQELWDRRPAPIRKGGTSEEWARWNAELDYWAEYYDVEDDIDWDEFFADSPAEE